MDYTFFEYIPSSSNESDCMNQINSYFLEELPKPTIQYFDIIHRSNAVEINNIIDACYEMLDFLLKDCTNKMIIELINYTFKIIDDIHITELRKTAVDFHRITKRLLREFNGTHKFSMIRHTCQNMNVMLYELLYDG